MATKTQYYCDICGTEKKSTNHWFYVNRTKQTSGEGFNLSPWDYSDSDLGEQIHICGQACAHKLLDQFLSHG